MKANGEMDDTAASQLKEAFSRMEDKSQNGTTDATVTGGQLMVVAGGPVYFNGISAYQNNLVDSIINKLFPECNITIA
jgi:hypothetical protein